MQRGGSIYNSSDGQPFVVVWLKTQGKFLLVGTVATFFLGYLLGGDYAYKLALFFFVMALSMSLTHVAIQRSSLRNGSPVQRTSMYIFAFLVSIPLLIFVSGQFSAWCCIQEDLAEELSVITKHATDILVKNNITYWVCGGSLLAAIREKDLPYQVLPWEHDFDLCFMKEDGQRARELWRQDPILIVGKANLYSFNSLSVAMLLKVPRVYIDLYEQYPNPENPDLLDSEDGAVKGISFPKDMIFPLKPIKHLNLMLNAPNKPEEVIQLTYGPNYMTPMFPPGVTGLCCSIYFDCSNRYHPQ